MAKKERKKKEVTNSYTQINNFDGVITDAMYIRNHGTIVRERDSKTSSISSIFVPDVKVKKKGPMYTLVHETQEMRDAKAAKRKEAKARKGKAGKKDKNK